MLSLSSVRTSPQLLEGQTISGDVYVFTSPDASEIDRVEFFIDDPAGIGPRFSLENNAPYDLAGGNSTVANPFDTGRLQQKHKRCGTAVHNRHFGCT